MPLSRFDIDRIMRQGYKFKDFVVKRRRERFLKNSKDRCVFLGDNGCTIYSFRPEGCRLYPLVYNENNRKVVIHDLCSYGHEFKVGRDDIENLYVLFNKLRAQLMKWKCRNCGTEFEAESSYKDWRSGERIYTKCLKRNSHAVRSIARENER